MSLRNSFDQSVPANNVNAPELQPVALAAVDQWANTMNFYHSTTDEMRQSMLAILSDDAKNKLYQHYLDDLDADIRQMEAAQHPASELARATHAKLASARSGSCVSVPDPLLFDALHKTNMLVKTPVLGADNNISPEFTQRAAEYTASMDNVKKASRENLAWGVCYAFCGALYLAGVALTFVLTFGNVLPNPDVTFNMFMAGSFGLLAALHVPRTVSFFSTYRNEKALADTMQPLVPALRDGNNGPGL